MQYSYNNNCIIYTVVMERNRLNRYGMILLALIILIFLVKIIPLKTQDQNIISDSIIPIDYELIGIDPNNYKTIQDFLSDTQVLPDMDIDISKDNFVICKKNTNDTTSYIPFYQSDIKNGFFDERDMKNLAIVDIYTSAQDECIFGWYWSDGEKTILFEEDIQHRDTYIINSIFSKANNMNDIIEELEQVKNNSIHKKELLWYLYDLKWDYSIARTQRNKICQNHSDTCEKKWNFNLNGIITDDLWMPLSNASITLLNDSKISTSSDNNGNYILDFQYYPFSHLRFKVTLPWYSDSFQTVSFNNDQDISWDKRENIDFVLHTPDQKYSVETKLSDNQISYDWKTYFEFRTWQSRYLLPLDALFLQDWSQWQWKNFEVYLYEFSKWDNIEGLVNVDTFNEVSGYVGNLMKTFGMPYIQFIDSQTWQELFVKKSQPMILQNSIYHMQELYDNYDQIYEAITLEDMNFLVSYSTQQGWYPIDFEFLTQNNFLRWPAWWVLDRNKWIWESVGSRVLTVDGLVELPFYSINDL